MIAHADELISHVAAHAGVGAGLAERVTRVVLAGLGAYLSPAHRLLIADELPATFGAQVLAGADLATPIEERVLACTTSLGHARELLASVCRVLGEELSGEALEILRGAVPPQLSRLLEVSAEAAPEAPPARSRERETLSSGRPGSHHPVSDARAPGAQTDSIVAENPHAATKLSSSTGSTQERHHETMAEGRPGYPNPLVGRRG